MHNKLSPDTLLKLNKNPHFKLTEDQKEQLAELSFIEKLNKPEIVQHTTKVKKTTTKVKKHSTKLKKESDEENNGFSGLRPIN